MEQETNLTNSEDIATTSWVSASRFIFYVYVAIAVALFFGMCYGLYARRYKGNPEVEVPSSTLYNPTYK